MLKIQPYTKSASFNVFCSLNPTARRVSQVALVVTNLPANAGDTGLILGQEDTLDEEIATHSNILA